MNHISRIAGALVASVLVCGASSALTGCASVAVSAGTTTAAALAEERDPQDVAGDLAIATNINALWLKYDAKIVTYVDATVNEGRVLLTGLAPNQQLRLDAVRLAWRTPGVRKVINEIEVEREGGIATLAQDSWITTQLVSRLSLDSKIMSINYSVETVGGVVYVMGIAQDQAELDRVKNHARQLRYVRRVVSYVRLKNDPARKK